MWVSSSRPCWETAPFCDWAVLRKYPYPILSQHHLSGNGVRPGIVCRITYLLIRLLDESISFNNISFGYFRRG